MDEELLAEAKRAEERLIEAEHDAEVARAGFHRAVRRLHLRGASLREVGAELGLSHQRVHQIVEAAGGGRRWGRSDPPSDLTSDCSFCGRLQDRGRQLVAGPGVYICEACVAVAGGVLSGGAATKTALGEVRAVPAESKRDRCSFCGRRRHQVNGLVATALEIGDTSPSDTTICSECLTLCREIFAEQLA